MTPKQQDERSRVEVLRLAEIAFWKSLPGGFWTIEDLTKALHAALSARLEAQGDVAKDTDFESWYVSYAFHYERDPIGSRDCSITRDAWKAGRSPLMDLLTKCKLFLEEMHVMPSEWTVEHSQVLHAAINAAITTDAEAKP